MKRVLIFSLSLIWLLMFVIACGQKMTEEQMNATAEDLQNKEQFEDATKMLEKLVKTYPEGKKADEALYKLGVIYANNLKDYNKSVNAYKKLVNDYPESNYVIQSMFMIGYRYANDIKDLDKAKEAYENFLEKYPDHELATSVNWELEHLGQDISDIEFLGQMGDSTNTREPNEGQ